MTSEAYIIKIRMKNETKLSIIALIFGVSMFLGERAFAGVWIMANGGSYWTQSGTEWHNIYNDGYCVSGRGPCGSSLWYLKWSWNHKGCGNDENANWKMASVQYYNGSVYAWIDSSTGSTYGADYTVIHNGISRYGSTVDQSAYYEAWAPVAKGVYKIQSLWLSDGWGGAYACNGVGGKQVEFDEIKLEI